MPPKRKQPDTAEATDSTASRSTRSSTRAKTKDENPAAPVKEKAPPKPKAAPKKKGPAKRKAETPSEDDDEGSEFEKPPVKKAKTKAAPKPKAPRAKKETIAKNDAKVDTVAVDDHPGPSKPIPAPAITEPEKPTLKGDPYSPAKALALFTTYADADSPDTIGPEGFEQICTDAEIPMEGALPILLSWQLAVKEMGKFDKAEWVKWTSAKKISSLPTLKVALEDLNALLVDGASPLKKPAKKTDEPYDRTEYWQYADKTKDAFHKLYLYSFALVKPAQSRNIEMDTAKAFWMVLLAPKYVVMNEVLEFINGREESYKAVNKDLWGMMLEFCETMGPNLDGYEADGAWPTLLDEFVAHKKGDSKAE